MTMLKPSHYRRLRGERLVGNRTMAVLTAAAGIGVLVGVAPSLEAAAQSIADMLKVRHSETAKEATSGSPLFDCTVTMSTSALPEGSISIWTKRMRISGWSARSCPAMAERMTASKRPRAPLDDGNVLAGGGKRHSPDLLTIRKGNPGPGCALREIVLAVRLL